MIHQLEQNVMLNAPSSLPPCTNSRASTLNVPDKRPATRELSSSSVVMVSVNSALSKLADMRLIADTACDNICAAAVLSDAVALNAVKDQLTEHVRF